MVLSQIESYNSDLILLLVLANATDGECEDLDPFCEEFMSAGHCSNDKYAKYMQQLCTKSCEKCDAEKIDNIEFDADEVPDIPVPGAAKSNLFEKQTLRHNKS